MRGYNSNFRAEDGNWEQCFQSHKFLFWRLLITLNGGWLNYIRTTLMSQRRESDLIGGFNLKHSS